MGCPSPACTASETEGASLHEHGIRYAPVTVTCPVHFPTHARSERPIPGRSRCPELRGSLSSRNGMAHRAVAICWQGRCCVPVVDGATSRGGLMAREHARETQEQEPKGGGEDRSLAEREGAHGSMAFRHSPFGLMRRLLDDLLTPRPEED